MRLQFKLSHLLLIVAAFAVLFGIWRTFGFMLVFSLVPLCALDLSPKRWRLFILAGTMLPLLVCAPIVFRDQVEEFGLVGFLLIAILYWTIEFPIWMWIKHMSDGRRSQIADGRGDLIEVAPISRGRKLG